MLSHVNWQNSDPKRLTFPVHGRSVVTTLNLSSSPRFIISGSDDHLICAHSPFTGEEIHKLSGHTGGVWSLGLCSRRRVTGHNTADGNPSRSRHHHMLASGSTDRTLRIWDLETAKNTHTFIGHTSTIRCIAVARPTWIDGADGPNRKEKWPKQAMIVTGSRDNTLRVWRFPRPGDPEYHGTTAAEDLNPTDEEIELNPYHLKALQGHEHAVRSVAVHGRTIVSGSYDTTVRVWDLITGEEKFVLKGHTQKVYSVVIDTLRQQTCSGSMDGTVRIWSLIDGSARHILTGHTSLVGLLSVSSNSLVSAAADAMVKIWNLSDGKLQHTLTGHLGAVTCVQNDDEKVITGADESLKVWNMKDGTFDRDLLKKPTVTGVWQIAFDGRFCVAATNQYDDTMVEVWDFANSRAPNDAVGKDGEDEEDEDVGADDDGAESDDEAGEVSGSHAQ